jgi:hypothetical protein
MIYRISGKRLNTFSSSFIYGTYIHTYIHTYIGHDGVFTVHPSIGHDGVFTVQKIGKQWQHPAQQHIPLHLYITLNFITLYIIVLA